MNQYPPYGNQPRPVQMALHSIIDQQHQGLVVSTFAYPGGWRAGSQVVWNMQDTQLPVKIYAAAFNPNGVESFEFFPVEAFSWVEPNAGIVPIGQNSKGMICMPPRPPQDALVNLVILKYRGGQQSLRVLDVQPAPNLWQATNDPPPQQGEGLFARIEYVEQGRAIEEEFYGVYSWNRTPGGGSVQVNWGFGRLFSFRAERGQLDALRQTFWQIAASLQSNPQWQQVRDQVQQGLTDGFMAENAGHHERFRQERMMGERNIAYNEHLINQRNNQVAASVEQQRQQNQERSERPYTPQEAVGDMLMNRTAVHDPNSAEGNYHYVEGNPTYIYTDNQGHFYSTDNPNDDPNVGSDRYWVPADPVKPRR